MLRGLPLPLALFAFPALAAPAHYHAQPTLTPVRQLFAARDNIWRCGETGCTSSRTSTRPAIVCATLVREVGALRSFSVEGRAFGAQELQACNSRAR